MRVSVFLLPVIFNAGSALFTTDFTQWLDETYDIGKRQWLERSDLQNIGSFGGREFENETLTHNPVVFVHGVNNVAGEMMRHAAEYYKSSRNYTFAEMYGTTYDNPEGDRMKWIKYTMKCDHVKRIRFLIEAVHAYTGRPVDVVAFSMGVTISRKSIFGGHCVETKEYLGGVLTSMMGTYIGVSGPNKGVAPVLLGIPNVLCALSLLIPVCNPIDGLFSGFCPFKSRFIDDINYYSQYEGQRIYTIGSKSDEVVGHMVCFDITTQIKGQTGEIIYNDKKHDETFISSYDTQLAMLNGEPF